MTPEESTRYDIETIMSALVTIRHEQANLRAMMTSLWGILCPGDPIPESRERMDS